MLTDKNRLSVVEPDLCREWNWKKNKQISPEDVSYGSHKKAWWICKKCNSSWIATIHNRTHGSGCPFCSGNSVNISNCLETLDPKLALEWHPTKNEKLTPYDVTCGSRAKAWWKCKIGHEWLASIKHRHISKSNCPYCSGQKVCIDNCLATINPKLASEWHPTKNGTLTPYDVLSRSNKNVWWICSMGHEWKAGIGDRSRPRFCPICNKIELKDGTRWGSLCEAYYYLKLKGRNIKFLYDRLYGIKNKNYRFDFYIPKFDTYIETTSFSKGSIFGKGRRNGKMWFQYLRKIVEKKNYVETVLGKKFRFIEIKLNKKQVECVRKHML